MNIEDFTIDLSGDIIPTRIFTPDNAGKEYCVLWLQGWSSAMDTHSESIKGMALASKTVFATLDTAGHGLHTFPLEKSTRKQRIDEITAVYDELKQRGYEKIIAIGGSHGGYMAALLCGIRPLHAVVLRAPANYPDNELELPYEQTRHGQNYWNFVRHMDSDDVLKNSAASEAIKNYDGFVYVFEHELDEIIPPKVPQHYFEVARHGNYQIIPKTPHSPKKLSNPQPSLDYIKHSVVATVQAIQLQDDIS